ncbi:hypothetical protein RRG08_011857 [Elysia crispata]|uniref:Uncharacterized protein n=1 Tax=Elysia crispata TaxID=231223 RepID=A0AAE1DIG4_9GAST|nr:hypothetical protein RRG08_011857 [Elysia crispata]
MQYKLDNDKGDEVEEYERASQRMQILQPGSLHPAQRHSGTETSHLSRTAENKLCGWLTDRETGQIANNCIRNVRGYIQSVILVVTYVLSTGRQQLGQGYTTLSPTLTVMLVKNDQFRTHPLRFFSYCGAVRGGLVLIPPFESSKSLHAWRFGPCLRAERLSPQVNVDKILELGTR